MRKIRGAWGRSEPPPPPFPNRARLIFALFVIFSRLPLEPSTGYIILVSHAGVSRMSYFLPRHLWGGRKYNSSKNACLRRSRHALMCSQFIRENEKSTHFCSKLRAKNGFYFSVLFDFCFLFTRVCTGCLVLTVKFLALDSCFCHLRSVRVFCFFPA